MRKNSLSYPVEFTTDVFGKDNDVLAETLRKVTGSERPRMMLVADMNVVQHTEGLGTRIGAYVQEHGIELAASPVVIAGGEKIKCDSLRSAVQVVSAALDAKIGCNDVMLGLGGGTLFDVAGWAAAQVRGGVKLVRVPTTPAAMIDGAFADNAALDSTNIKDAIRVACTPAAVVIDTSFAKTVLDGVWRGGFAAAVKLAVTTNKDFVRLLAEMAPNFKERTPEAIDGLVKAAYESRVAKGADTFGEWAALRLESMSSYKLPHGYALALGVLIDSYFAVQQGLFKDKDLELVEKMLADSGAKEGASHSRHLVQQVDSLLAGLSAWRLSHPDGIVVPAGLGKAKKVENPDREAMKTVLNMIK